MPGTARIGISIDLNSKKKLFLILVLLKSCSMKTHVTSRGNGNEIGNNLQLQLSRRIWLLVLVDSHSIDPYN